MTTSGPWRHRSGSLAAALSLVLTCCSDAETDKAGGSERFDTTVLTFAGNSGAPTQIAPYLQEVQRRSNGTLRIDYKDRWREGQPGQEQGLIEDVQAGEVDIAWVGARAFDAVGVTSFQALVAPLLIDSYDLQRSVFEAGIPAEMLESLDTIGLTGIGVLPGPMRKVLGISHPFTEPSDFVGEVVGPSGGVLAEQTIRTLGAIPQIVPSETALAGLDALEYQLAAIEANSYYNVARHVTGNLNLWPRPLVIFMNTDRFNALTADQQALLRDAATNAIGPASDASRDEDSQSSPPICGSDLVVDVASATDLVELADAIAPVYAPLEEDANTAAYLDAIRTLKDEIDTPADSFVCPPDDGNASTGESTPIDGVYDYTTTVDDLRRAGDPAPREVNYGTWTYVFDRGHFAYTLKNGEICQWAYGTYDVDGDQLSWSFVDGGGTNGKANRPGEQFVFGWSLYRDSLTLTALPGEISPLVLIVEPWHRTSATASADALDPDCPPPDEALPG